MTPSIIPADSLDRVVGLVTARFAGTAVGLAEADRRLVEAVLGSACHGPAARDEYLTALTRSAGGRPKGAAGPHDPAWGVLIRDGLPGLSDEELLALAASPATLRELNQRVGAALRDGTLTGVWWSYYDAFPMPPDPAMDERFRETVEVFRRLHDERSGRANAPRSTGIHLTREVPPLNMAAADDAEAVRFHGADGTVLEVYPSHRPGLSELSLVPTPPPGEIELLVDGVPVPLVTPFDRLGFAAVPSLAMTAALRGRAELELRLHPPAAGSTVPPPTEDAP